MLLLHKSGTITVAHSRSRDLPALCREADIVVAAVGRAKLITGDMIKPGAVVIDVGMNRDENGKLCGDVDFDSVAPVASKITPVPGGVGPMTISMLLRNTLTAARLRGKKVIFYINLLNYYHTEKENNKITIVAWKGDTTAVRRFLCRSLKSMHRCDARRSQRRILTPRLLISRK